MIRVCPNPIPWVSIHKTLSLFAHSHPDLTEPPTPLILAGWVGTNDSEKINRWAETLQWAKNAGCDDLIETLSDDDYYFTDEVSTYQIGPYGGPMYRDWDHESKDRPAEDAINAALQKLIEKWPNIAVGFAAHTRPIAFTGAKARRLVVSVTSDSLPPWGDWDRLSPVHEARRSFTTFRQTINEILKPLEVDHVDFIKQGPKDP